VNLEAEVKAIDISMSSLSDSEALESSHRMDKIVNDIDVIKSGDSENESGQSESESMDDGNSTPKFVQLKPKPLIVRKIGLINEVTEE
jgi:hypothetical protein